MPGVNWPNVSQMFERALSKGDLEKSASAQLLLGIALYSQGKADKSRTWFERAARDGSTRNEAEGWLRLLESEASKSASAE